LPKKIVGKLTKQERELFKMWRDIGSQDERDAFALLMSNLAWGDLNKSADKVPLKKLLPY
jgi:hypothetical protein